MTDDFYQFLFMTPMLLLFGASIYVFAVRGIQEVDLQSPELREKYSKLKLPFFNYRKH